MINKSHTRREFLFNSTKITTSTVLASSFINLLVEKVEARALTQDPINKLHQITSTAIFTGDEPDPNHERLWNVDDYIQKCGGIPAPTEQQNIVVIGGGLSGLISAYYLQNYRPLVLEQASQFGGNSKAESLGNSIYSLGPAYISPPDPGSESAKMLNQIGVLKYGKLELKEHKTIFLNGRKIENFWSGNHDNPQIYQQFVNLLKNYEKLNRRQLQNLNKITMKMWITKNFPQITAILLEYLEYYSWSSFGAMLDEVAAGEFLSWQASEQHGILVFPGGNSLIAQGLYQYLKSKFGNHQLRTKSTVLKVIPGNGFVDIVTEESLYKLKTIRAKFAIIAAPKFVAKRIVASLPAVQFSAMSNIEYRSYLVGNVVLRKRVPSKGFDVYCLDGKVPTLPTATTQMADGFTDMIFANWAQNDQGSPSVITLYKAFPYQGARQYLLNPLAHNKHRDFMLSEFRNYLATIGIQSQDVAAIRMTLWGHAVPVCHAGFAGSKEMELANRPVGNILFANQDNYLSPSFESAEAAAIEAAQYIVKQIDKIG